MSVCFILSGCGEGATFLNVGSGRVHVPGWVSIDRLAPRDRPWLIPADIRALPFRDDSFDGALASHILEHIVEVRDAIRELHRVLKEGATLIVRVPYGVRALTDPFHVRAFDLRSFARFAMDDPNSLECDRLFEIVSLGITDYEMPLPFDYLIWSPKVSFLHAIRGLVLRLFRVRHPDRRIINPFPLTRRKEITCRLRTIKST